MKATVNVTIMVTDVDEAPMIMVGGLAVSGRSSVQYAENGMGMVATYTASGPDAASARWSLSGDDARDFTITGGVLAFSSTPDYENPADMGGDNVYQVTVEADDGTYMDTQDVTVTVTNVDEDGEVTLSATRPAVGMELTADLTDPDGGVTGETWQWASSATADATFADIGGATSAGYMPVDGDATRFLRATVSYTDAEGSGKSAMAVSENMVTVGDPLLAEYDPNNDDMIEKADMRRAVADYFGLSPTLSKADMRRLVGIYFSQ